MRKSVVIIVIGIVLCLCFSSGAFSARGGGGHGGGGHGGGFHGGGFHGGGWHGYYGFRAGFYGPYWGWPGFGPWGYPYAYPYGYSYPYPYPYSYSSPAYPSAALPAPSQPQQSYWYYCQDPKGYYPYVQSCPGGWVQVTPTPPQGGKEGEAQ